MGDRVGAGVGSQHSMKSPSPLGQHLSSSPKSRDAHEPVGFAVCAEQRLSIEGDTDGDGLGLFEGLVDGLHEGLPDGRADGLALGASVLSQQERYSPDG